LSASACENDTPLECTSTPRRSPRSPEIIKVDVRSPGERPGYNVGCNLRVGNAVSSVDLQLHGAAAAGPARRAFSRKRQNSEQPGADRRNYSRSRSHLRAAVAMIGMKSPGLDGGYGVCAKTGTCSWGRAVAAYYLGGAGCLTRLSSIGAARLAAPFLDRNKDASRRACDLAHRVGSMQPTPTLSPISSGLGPRSRRANFGNASPTRVRRLRICFWPAAAQ
jgi:hypothetical protein